MLNIDKNWTLSNKKVALTPREPLSVLRGSSVNPNWRAVVQDIWNYYVNSANVECPRGQVWAYQENAF